jgi:hydrogenase maturation protein HypF
LDNLTLFEAVFTDWQRGLSPERISRRFHLGLSQGLAAWGFELAEMTRIRDLALSGGVLQNMTLQAELSGRLQALGLRPLVHTRVPPNDACISLGQAYYGQCLLGL